MFKLFKIISKLRVPVRQFADQNRGNFNPDVQKTTRSPDFNIPSQNQSQKGSQIDQNVQGCNRGLEENRSWQNMQPNQNMQSNEFTQQSGQQYSQPNQTSLNQGSGQMSKNQSCSQSSSQMEQNQSHDDQSMTEKVKETVDNVMKMTAGAYETVKEKTVDMYEAVKEKVDKVIGNDQTAQTSGQNVQDSKFNWDQSQGQSQSQFQSYSQNQSSTDTSTKSGSQKLGDEVDKSLIEKVKEKVSDTSFNAREKIGMTMIRMKEAITEPYSTEDSVKYSKKAFESAQGTHDPDSPFIAPDGQTDATGSSTQRKK